MSFPQDPRDVAVAIKIDGVWTDISSDVYSRNDINVQRGYEDENGDPKPSTCSFTLNNRLGKYSPRNPLGTYYGKIGRNTQVRLGVAGIGINVLKMNGSTDAALTNDTAALSIVGDIDIRSEFYATGATNIAGKYVSTGNQLSWNLSMTSSAVTLRWSTNGSTVKTASSSTGLPYNTRQAVRATLDVDNGASGWTATFYSSDSINGSWVQIGSPVTGAGVTSIFDSTSVLEVGATPGNTVSINSYFVGFQLRNGINGTVVSSTDYSSLADTTSSFVDAQSNSWSFGSGSAAIQMAAISRFYGEISSWPAQWDNTGRDAFVQISAAGILRRLGQGSSPVSTAIRSWTKQQVSGNYIAENYWALEEGSLAFTGSPDIGSSIVTVTSTGTASFQFGAGDLRLPWLVPVLELTQPNTTSTNTLSSSVLLHNFSVGWEVDFFFACDENSIITFNITTSDSKVWTVTIDGTNKNVGVTKPGGPISTKTLGFNVFDGVGKMAQLRCTQSGSDIHYNFVVSNNYQGTSFFGTNAIVDDGFSGTYSSATLTATTSFTMIASAPTSNSVAAVGHIIFASVASSGGSLYSVEIPAAGNINEQADTRISRLCTEKNISFSFTDVTTELMGPQQAIDFLSLVDECLLADASFLYESKTSFQLVLKSRKDIHNSSAAISLSYSAGNISNPFEPVDDDLNTRNSVTVERPDGGQAIYEKTTGSLSILDPPNGVGKYDTSISANVSLDSQLQDIAGWYVSLGTVDEARYPRVAVNLASQSAPSASTILNTISIGSRIDITNATAINVYDTVKLLVLGYQETINTFAHKIIYNCVPFSPYEVLKLNTSGNKIDSGSSTVNTNLTSNGTSMSVATSDPGDLWGTGTVSISIMVGGEEMTVTNISGSSSPQTFTVTRSVNGVVKAQTAGTTVKLKKRATLALT